MKKTARPSSSMPTCSCGWACSSTTERGSRSTTEIIIFSAEQVRMCTPGKVVWREHSSGVGKNSLTRASPQETQAPAGTRPGPRWRLMVNRGPSPGQHEVDLGALLDDQRQGPRVEDD